MKIAGLVKTSTIDYPGRISCVVFTSGCNYACFYCHNKAFLSGPPLLDEAECFSFLEKRKNLLDGVVISGGEPTQQEELLFFALKVKGMAFIISPV
ncbi:MAG: 4Fe-4S cluster-binding domain-containing protein [Dehalococcoidia bacterium]|nr:4Fe-4S cluster-binding domain-containing protein [Dehalococcoidia bacterium]